MWIVYTTLLRPSATLAPAGSALLRDSPDRLLIGLDLFVAAHYRPDCVAQMVGYYRGLLGQLDPAAAALIGHRNAERIAGLQRGGDG